MRSLEVVFDIWSTKNATPARLTIHRSHIIGAPCTTHRQLHQRILHTSHSHYRTLEGNLINLVRCRIFLGCVPFLDFLNLIRSFLPTPQRKCFNSKESAVQTDLLLRYEQAARIWQLSWLGCEIFPTGLCVFGL